MVVQNSALVVDGTNILESESESVAESLPESPLTPISRRKTFGTGSVSPPAKAKRTLRRIFHERIHQLKCEYVYDSLSATDEIRILRIMKGQRDQKIQCALLPRPFPLSGTSQPNTVKAFPKYDALSYWWGDDDASCEIIMNTYEPHLTGSKKHSMEYFEHHDFYVRPNLEAALRQIRSEEHDIDIWVDAICINQQDSKEKTTQVSRMHEIYNCAENVCVWLGAGVPETKETFNFLREILNLQRLDQLIESGEEAEKWELVVRLMENKWFSRRWVIQELAFARNALVLWGTERMAWSNFADAIALFMTKHDEITRIVPGKLVYPYTSSLFGDARALGANTLVNATNDLFRRSQDGRIQQKLLSLEVLVSCRFLAFEASDPRDIIFAVLSVAKDTSCHTSELTARTSCMISPRQRWTGIIGKVIVHLFLYPSQVIYNLLPPMPEPTRPAATYEPRLAPDYDKSLIDVLADFMDYCIENSKSLDILCRHWAPLPRRKTLRDLCLPSGPHKEDKERMPSWIPSIKGDAFGDAEDRIRGRMNGDSFVGSPERQNQQQYDASAGLLPCVRFGRYVAEKDQMDHVTHQASFTQLLNPFHRIIRPSQSKPWPLSQKYDGTLYIKGFRLDQITRLSDRVTSGIIQDEALEMGGWHTDCIDPTVPDQLWRTLVADRGPNGISAPAWYHRACRECLTLVDHLGDLKTSDIRSSKGTPSTIVSFLDRVQRVTWNRRFFLAEAEGDVRVGRRPRFGLAPQKARSGDWICVLFGCSVPVLLREVGAGSESYFELVGECYVHGYMDGEAVPSPRPLYPYDRAMEFNLR